MAKVTLYVSSVSGNLALKKHQQQIELILQGKKIAYETVDIAADEAAKEYMKSKSGKTALPQIFVDGVYKGGFEEFDNANEAGELEQFFGH